MNHHCEKIRQTQNQGLKLNLLHLAAIGVLLYRRWIKKLLLFIRKTFSMPSLVLAASTYFGITRVRYTFLSVVVFATLLLTSCTPVKTAVFQHPMVGSTSGYHAMPVASDGIKSANYASASFSIGGIGYDLNDDIFSFQGSFHRAVLLNNVRMYGGGMLSAGRYGVNSISYVDPIGTPVNLDSKSTSLFFGSYGVFGGVSLSAPVGRRNEWRYIGIEGGLWREFGDYLSFRKNLPDSAYIGVDRKRMLGSLGLSTEIIFKRRTGFKSGLKFANGFYFRNSEVPEDTPISLLRGNSSSNNPLFYSAFTYHFTIRRSTAYFQANVASRATNLQIGYNYRF